MNPLKLDKELDPSTFADIFVWQCEHSIVGRYFYVADERRGREFKLSSAKGPLLSGSSK